MVYIFQNRRFKICKIILTIHTQKVLGHGISKNTVGIQCGGKIIMKNAKI
jgi:hypothetical protein